MMVEIWQRLKGWYNHDPAKIVHAIYNERRYTAGLVVDCTLCGYTGVTTDKDGGFMDCPICTELRQEFKQMKKRSSVTRKIGILLSIVLFLLGVAILVSGGYDTSLAILYRGGVVFRDGYTPDYIAIFIKWFAGAIFMIASNPAGTIRSIEGYEKRGRK